jgi:hypothetical protein
MLRAAFLVLSCVLACAAWAEPVEDIRQSAITILKAQAAFDGGATAGLRLDGEIVTLTRLLNGSELDEYTQATAHYYRAQAAMLNNNLRVKNKQRPDADLARRAIEDYDWVIERNRDVRQMRVSVANAAYNAGLAARNFLGDVPLAYKYWQKCAQREHAGCMNMMASAKVTGEGGVAVDVPGALELHKQVYDTGTSFTCAGAYSALATAQILYFSGAQGLTVGELDWLKRANLLLDEVAAERKWKSPCNRPRFRVAEYLMRLDRGEDRPSVLAGVAETADEPEEKVAVGYLLGGVSEAAFREAAAKGSDRESICEMQFAALWYAEIKKDAKASADHYQALSSLGQCTAELALVKMKYRH